MGGGGRNFHFALLFLTDSECSDWSIYFSSSNSNNAPQNSAVCCDAHAIERGNQWMVHQNLQADGLQMQSLHLPAVPMFWLSLPSPMHCCLFWQLYIWLSVHRHTYRDTDQPASRQDYAAPTNHPLFTSLSAQAITPKDFQRVQKIWPSFSQIGAFPSPSPYENTPMCACVCSVWYRVCFTICPDRNQIW